VVGVNLNFKITRNAGIGVVLRHVSVYANPVFSGGRRPRGAAYALQRLAGLSVLSGLLVAMLILPLACTVGLGARDTADWFQGVPDDLKTPELAQRSRILATDGSTIATFYFENRIDVRLDQVAPIARQSVLAIEDSRFYEHGALDSRGTVRALLNNLHSGTGTQGGSGITQQYVKNMLAETAQTKQERQAALAVTPARKLRELRYAVALERQLSKDEILRRYLNIAYFGDGAYGIEAAARHYFSKPAAKLNLAESATLAGIVRNPYAYNPHLHPAAGRARRDVVLARMAELGWITRAQAAGTGDQPLVMRISQTQNGCVTSKAPFFCDYVQREILTNPAFGKTADARKKLLQRGGLTIQTTLDWKVQRAAQRAIDRHVPARNSAHKAAAETLIQPGTGEIKGMAVDRKLGPDKERGKTWINFAADADHGASIGMPAGSTFKVFTLAAALDQGLPFGTRLNAPSGFVPTGYRNCQGQRVGDTKTLHNSSDGEGGRSFSLVTGTWHSVNTFFLGLERKVGLCATVKMAERLGMRQGNGKPLEQFPSFTLGFNPVSPTRMAAAYAAFAARGRYCQPIAIKKITGSTGKPVQVPSADCHQAISKGVADAVNHVLRGVLTKGTAGGQGIGRPAAGKTGTVDDFSAAWFAGYTPDLASAVWMGDPRGGFGHPMNDLCMNGNCYGAVFGATIPAPIWHDTMEAALSGTPGHGFHAPPRHYFSKGSGEDNVRIPDVRGLSPAAAVHALTSAGFKVQIAITGPYSDKYPKGTVAVTSPGPGAPTAPGTTVTLSISKGKDPKSKSPKPKSPGPGQSPPPLGILGH
jgi:membrane peptidoglycan carboxypeptidase